MFLSSCPQIFICTWRCFITLTVESVSFCFLNDKDRFFMAASSPLKASWNSGKFKIMRFSIHCIIVYCEIDHRKLSFDVTTHLKFVCAKRCTVLWTNEGKSKCWSLRLRFNYDHENIFFRTIHLAFNAPRPFTFSLRSGSIVVVH